MKVKLLSRVRLLATPWTAAYQAPPSMGFSRQEYWNGVPLPSPIACWDPLSMGFPRQEYWSGLPFLSPGDLLEPGIAPPTSPTLAGRFFTAEPPGQPVIYKYLYIIVFIFDSVQFS